MAYNKSARKGSNFERAIARTLSEWWCGDSKSLYRVVGSGARKDVRMAGGDIQPTSDKARPFPFCVECKKSERWSLTRFILGYPGEPLWDYLGQCLQAARQAENSVPLLICAANRQPPLVFIGTGVLQTAVPEAQRRVPLVMRLRVTEESIPYGVAAKYRVRYIDQMVMPLASFLASFSRGDFARLTALTPRTKR